jgi:hypothetical protein
MGHVREGPVTAGVKEYTVPGTLKRIRGEIDVKPPARRARDGTAQAMTLAVVS